jgi:hypothetical protein
MRSAEPSLCLDGFSALMKWNHVPQLIDEHGFAKSRFALNADSNVVVDERIAEGR